MSKRLNGFVSIENRDSKKRKRWCLLTLRIGRHKTEKENLQLHFEFCHSLLWNNLKTFHEYTYIHICVYMYASLITNWTLQSYRIERNMFWTVFQIFFSYEKGIIKMIFWLEWVYFSVLTLEALAELLGPGPKWFHQANATLKDLWVAYQSVFSDELFPWMCEPQYLIKKFNSFF